MRDYELAFIVEPSADDEGVTAAVDQISGYIQAGNGEVTSVDVWGRKPLAYPIDDHREGTYVLLIAKMPPASVLDLERNLKLFEPVIRYLLIVKEDES